MNSFSTIAFVLVLVPLFVWSNAIETRIVGGLPALDEQFKYQVSLRTSQLIHFCGGSIIKPHYVLTSAKCLYGKNPGDVYVVAGTNYLTPNHNSISALQLIVHGSYDSSSFQNNIALVKTSRNLLNIPKTATIGLNIAPTHSGQSCTLTGWGKEHISLPYSNILRYVDLHVMSFHDCREALHGYTITNSNLCTSPAMGRGGCDGDNGGPLVTYNVQIGILSWGLPCATGKPDVYTDVASYYIWIGANTR